MTDPDRPRRRTGKLPSFHQPPTPDLAPDPLPETLQDPLEGRHRDLILPPAAVFVDGEPVGLQRDLPIPNLGPGARTRTSATTDDDEDQGVDPKVIAGLVAAILGIGATIAAAAVKRMRRGHVLRRPSEKQLKDFAKPASAILLRHFEIAHLSRDLVDGIQMAGVAGRYIEEGPLVIPGSPDAGIPPDINQPDESEDFS